MKRTFVYALSLSAVYFLALIAIAATTNHRRAAEILFTLINMLFFGAVCVLGSIRGWASPVFVFLACFLVHIGSDWVMGFGGDYHGAAIMSLVFFVIAAIGCIANPANWKGLGTNTGVHPAFQAFVYNSLCLIPFIPFFAGQ